ncbi:hypothetical protein [Nocardioides currus]|uniref:PH domain-containing protein n=1 Tax=Nocardioides currus TaxID=2133958 RepID=A0A2R7YVR5_9ACTN|nr:hypothetical protein [Nocardioides currus]PUA80421.1 hypothetical protein C7S10_14970 [Nocardioides currus]
MSDGGRGWAASSPLVPLVPLVVGVDVAVAAAALHTAIAPPLGGWAYVYGVATPAAALGAMVWVGRRLAPIWTFPVAIASVLVNGALLSITEWLALLLLPLGVAALLSLRRLPAHVPEPPVFEGGTVAASPEATPPPFTDSDRVPEDGVVTIPLISRTRTLAMLVLSVGVGIVGFWALRAGLVDPDLIVDGGPAGRALAGFFGLMFLLLGIGGVWGMSRILRKGADLEVDATALRARGAVDFELPWTEVERIGLRVRIVHVPGRAVASRKRDIWIAVDPVSEGLLDRRDIPWLRARGSTSPAPRSFTAELTIADPYYREPSPTVVALDDALRRMVPGKYVGIIRD